MAKEKPKEKQQPKKASKAERKREPKGPGKGKYIAGIVLVVVIIVVAIFASGLLTTMQPDNNFNAFRQNFNSAPRVDIFVAAYNGTVLSGTISCATAVIEQIVASRTNHRNATTIDLNIINQTSCIRSRGLGGNSSNYTTTSLQNCLNSSSTEPTIYINYSTSTNTTIIRPEYLYISGTDLFLRECGVASQIS